MRIDLEKSEHRPFPLRLAMAGVKRYVGVAPPPLLFATYDTRLLHGDLRNYLARGTSAFGAWDKGESELFASFVSTLNSCRF